MNIPSTMTDEERYKHCKFVCECGYEDCQKVFSNPMSWINADLLRPTMKSGIVIIHSDCSHADEFNTVKILDGVFLVENKK